MRLTESSLFHEEGEAQEGRLKSPHEGMGPRTLLVAKQNSSPGSEQQAT